MQHRPKISRTINIINVTRPAVKLRVSQNNDSDSLLAMAAVTVAFALISSLSLSRLKNLPTHIRRSAAVDKQAVTYGITYVLYKNP